MVFQVALMLAFAAICCKRLQAQMQGAVRAQNWSERTGVGQSDPNGATNPGLLGGMQQRVGLGRALAALYYLCNG
jgi:ABC-type proline/glycine betaine transport system ATPase subunit